MESATQKIAVVIPCFRVKSKIEETLNDVVDKVEKIFVVDDCCDKPVFLGPLLKY